MWFDYVIFYQGTILLVVVLAMLWSPVYAKFLIKYWFPHIDDILLGDFVGAGTRIALSIATVMTVVTSIGYFTVLLIFDPNVRSTCPYLFYGTVLFYLTAATFTMFVMPSIPQGRFREKTRLGLSYHQMSWGIIILINIWQIILRFLII